MPGSISDYIKDAIESMSASKTASQIIEQVKKINPNLKVSSIWRNGKNDNPNSMHYTGQAVDFIGPLTELYNTFLTLKDNGFVGGVGLGIDKADRHLHVDLRPERAIWFETDKKVDPNGLITVVTISESNKAFPDALSRASKQYFATTPIPAPPLDLTDKIFFGSMALGSLFVLRKTSK